MKLGLYAFKNKKLGAFTGVFTQDNEKEHVVIPLERSLLIAEPETMKKYIGLELYKVGVFDDVSGAVVAENDYLIDCDAYVHFESQEVVKNDGKIEN